MVDGTLEFLVAKSDQVEAIEIEIECICCDCGKIFIRQPIETCECGCNAFAVFPT